jgi:hypothetical protein
MPSTRPASEAEFSGLRHRLVQLSSRFGSAGPGCEGLGPNDAQDSTPIPVPEFYAVDDQLSEYRRAFLEVTPEALSAEWLTAVGAELRTSDGWDVLVKVGEGILIRIDGASVTVFGLPPAILPLEDAVEAVRRHVHAAATAKSVAAARRRTTVGVLTRTVWPSEPADLSFIGVFRDRSDGSEGLAVWLLHRRDQSAFDLDDYDFEPDALRPSTFWGFPSGRLIEYTPGSREEGGRLVAEWALVDHGRPVTDASVLKVHKGGRSWSFDLRQP